MLWMEIQRKRRAGMNKRLNPVLGQQGGHGLGPLRGRSFPKMVQQAVTGNISPTSCLTLLARVLRMMLLKSMQI